MKKKASLSQALMEVSGRAAPSIVRSETVVRREATAPSRTGKKAIAGFFDPDVTQVLQKALESEGVKFHLETTVTSVAVQNGNAKVDAIDKGKQKLEFRADKVLVAVGRKPYLSGAVAKDLGLKLTERGRVAVDETYRTNIPGLYAIGDVIDGPMLAHKGEDEGVACVERIAGKAGHVNYDAIPNVIYTNPEVAGVGIILKARDRLSCRVDRGVALLFEVTILNGVRRAV